MGKRFQMSGEEVEVPDGAPAKELKEEDPTASDVDKVTYTDPQSGESVIVDDEQSVDDIPEGTNVSTMPVKGGLYG